MEQYDKVLPDKHLCLLLEKVTKMGDSTQRDTLCFSYEVTMVIQILAENEEEARSRLEVDGGFISRREVTLKDAVSVFSGTAEEEKEE